MSVIALLRYLAWGMCFLALGLFAAYALKNVRATEDRTGHRLTAVAAIAFIDSFVASAVAAFFVPEPYLIYPAVGVWFVGLAALGLREGLRWRHIRYAYSNSLAKAAKVYFETQRYLVLSTIFVLSVLPVWVFFILRPFGVPLSWAGIGSLGFCALAVMNLALLERQFYEKARSRSTKYAGKPAPQGRKDVITVNALEDFINMLLARTRAIAASPVATTLADHFDANPVLFGGCRLPSGETVEFAPVLRNLERIPEENRMSALCSSFSVLVSRIARIYGALVSPQWIEQTIEDCYRATEARFRNTPAPSQMVLMMPEGVLENEKLAFLTKDQLEGRVRQRTRDLEESREQLRALKDFHEQIATKAPVGIVRTDREGKTVFINPKAMEILGLPETREAASSTAAPVPAPVEGEPAVVAGTQDNTKAREWNPVDVLDVEETLRAAHLDTERLRGLATGGQNGAEFHGDCVFTSRQGKAVHASLSVAPLANRSGQFDGLLFLIEDITAKKALEEERQRVDKLESLGVLAGGIAHDFNNLLTGIMGNIGAARLVMAGEREAAALLDEAERASVRATHLTRQLLTFSRGGQPVKKLVSLAELIIESVNFALRGFPVKAVLSLPDDLWSVDADEGQINQVIINLTRNAQQAMPQGGFLNIGARNVEPGKEGHLPLPPGTYVELTVADHGVGIPKENLSRLFEPYFTTKRTGSGLGLATCYSIIKNHNGHISIESEPGAGTTVHVFLPASGRRAQTRQPVREGVPSRGAGRILVMDDEEMIRDMLRSLLRLLGYEAEGAADGAEAIHQYREAKESGRPFAAVIMDLTVPGGMGGQEAVTRLLEIDPGVKAIVSSGYATDGVMSDPRKSGFCGAVCKPYTTAELEKVLSQVLKRE